ncbi:MAG: L,D-transpeptidase [Streptococcaceae bacterium]|jgi:hypothetical protein|nr:L,D-transpeptidase [Streptococcaceae bacterium]
MKSRKQLRKKQMTTGKIIGIGGLAIILVLTCTGFFYFQDHFLPNTTVAGLEVGFKTPEQVKKVFDQRNSQGVSISLDFQGAKKTLTLKNIYQELPLSAFEQAKKGTEPTLVINQVIKEEIQQKITQLATDKSVSEKTGAKINFNATTSQFEVVNAKKESVLDIKKLTERIFEKLSNYQATYEYQTSSFMKEIYPQDVVALQEKAKQMNNLNTVATFTYQNQKVEITKQNLGNFINTPQSISEFVKNEIYMKLSTTANPVHWKNPVDGHIYEFINNQAYGWNVDVEATTKQIEQMITDNNYGQTLEPVMKSTFAKGAEEVIQNNFVWIDTDKQIMQLWMDGKLVNQTDVITGFWDKGTATVSGFQTISWKTDFINMKGDGLNGTKYEVPINYAECLLYRPYNSPTTGNHTQPYETGIFIHEAKKSAEDFANKVNMQQRAYGVGSNGCIGTPVGTAKIYYDNLINGFPVIVTGHYYDNAPGEFDKPVDYGHLIA